MATLSTKQKEAICEAALNGEITKKFLNNEVHLTDTEIQELIATSILLSRIYDEDVVYILIDADMYYEYGKILRGVPGREEAAHECLVRCFDLGGPDFRACFMLFKNAILEKNYPDAIYYIRYLYEANKDDPKYRHETLYYLYLLNQITTLPEDLMEVAKNIKFSDIEVPSDSDKYSDIAVQNNERRGAYFFESYSRIFLSHPAENRNYHQTVIRTMASEAHRIKNERNNTIITSINNGEYQQAIQILEEKKKRRKLTKEEYYTLYITKLMLKIQKPKEPINDLHLPEFLSSDILYNAINTRNFNEAIKILSSDGKNPDITKNILYAALNKIYELTSIETKKCFAELLIAIKNANYEKTLELIDKILASENNYYKRNAKYYLYLLSKIYTVNLSQKHKDIVRSLTIDDVLVSEDDTRYSNPGLVNESRRNMLEGTVAGAIGKLEKLIQTKEPKEEYKTEDILLRRAQKSLQEENERMKFYLAIAYNNFIAARRLLDIIIMHENSVESVQDLIDIYKRVSGKEYNNPCEKTYYYEIDFKGICSYFENIGITSPAEIFNICSQTFSSNIKAAKILLMYARESYIKGDVKKGKKFIKAINNIKNGDIEKIKIDVIEYRDALSKYSPNGVYARKRERHKIAA